MPRVKSHNGCVTCRRRRKKCGEEKPICNTCRRLKLFCSYNEDQRDRRPAPEVGIGEKVVDRWSRLQPQIEAFASINPESVFVGDFHKLPVSDVQRKEVVELCGRLVSSLMTNVWPFSLAQAQLREVRNCWLGPSFSNGTQMCLSVAGLSAGIEARGDLKSGWQLVRARYESQALAMMRSRLRASQPAMPDFVSLICAAHLPITAISRNVTDIQLGKLAQGVRSLLRQFGGLQTFISMKAHHVLEVLVRAEWISCIVLGEASAYLNDFKQPMAPGADFDPTRLILPHSVSVICDINLINLIQAMKVLLHHRSFGGQTVMCSNLSEYYYLTDLLNRVSLQLAHAQSEYKHSETPRECLTYALILLRIDVLGHRWLHPRLGDLMSKALLQAILKTSIDLWIADGALDVLMWVLCVGATLCHDEKARKYCSDQLSTVLPYVFAPENRALSFDLVVEVEERLWLVVWHRSMSQGLRAVLQESNFEAAALL